jgi:hypothetical protein
MGSFCTEDPPPDLLVRGWRFTLGLHGTQSVCFCVRIPFEFARLPVFVWLGAVLGH